MKINKLDSQLNTFKAHKISKVNVFLQEGVLNYDLYKITHKDQQFLDLLKTKIDLRALWQGLRFIDYEQWDYIIKKSAEFSQSNKNFGYLLAKDKIPCGLMNCTETLKGYYVDYVATWPFEVNLKAPFAGKTLFMQLFKDLLIANKNFIRLNSIKDDPFDVYSKYVTLGFTSLGGEVDCEMMRIEQESVTQKIRQLDSKIKFISTYESEQNLDQRLII